MKKIILLFGICGIMSAECVCSCVNGRVEALCDNSFEMRPMCEMRLCEQEMPPPFKEPEMMFDDAVRLPEFGTNKCSNERVYNEMTNQYEWQVICR